MSVCAIAVTLLPRMGPSIRLCVNVPLGPGAAVESAPGQAHYLRDVMRRPVGAEVRLFNGQDGEWSARIATLARDRATFDVAAQTREQQAEPDIWLFFSPLRRDMTELVVQKATELGAARIGAVLTARTEHPRVNLDRWRAIATEAAEQCERLTLPEIAEPVRLAELFAVWPQERALLACLEWSDAPMLAPVPPPAALLVGPKGGFAPEERGMIGRFARPVSLGTRVLRAETAAIAGLALLLIPLAAPPSAP
jgi:16S rRNA (uracil1498-N3)-methyltransferase